MTNWEVLLQVAPLLRDKNGRGYCRQAGKTENECVYNNRTTQGHYCSKGEGGGHVTLGLAFCLSWSENGNKDFDCFGPTFDIVFKGTMRVHTCKLSYLFSFTTTWVGRTQDHFWRVCIKISGKGIRLSRQLDISRLRK